MCKRGACRQRQAHASVATREVHACACAHARAQEGTRVDKRQNPNNLGVDAVCFVNAAFERKTNVFSLTVFLFFSCVQMHPGTCLFMTLSIQVMRIYTGTDQLLPTRVLTEGHPTP